jgi:hypothetical protein
MFVPSTIRRVRRHSRPWLAAGQGYERRWRYAQERGEMFWRLMSPVLVAILLAMSAPLASARPPAAVGSPSAARPQGLNFHSDPDLHPPRARISADSDQGSGDIFLTPVSSYQRRVVIQHGPMIVDPRGRLIWFDHIAGIASDLSVQTYREQPVLTWWQLDGGVPVDVIMDRSYRRVATLHAANGYGADEHEFQITPQGTALIDAYVPVPRDLSRIGGPTDGKVEDCVIQELAIPSGRLLWEWHSLSHVPLRDSYIRPTGKQPFDYFHLNSIQQLPGGNLLISARHTWGIYEIGKRTGRVLWELGGKHSSFRSGRGARFSWQHDARLRGRTLSLFDDGSDGPSRPETQSSAKFLTLDLKSRPMRATLLRRYTHTPPLSTGSQGNTQLLPNHDVFVGWGADPEFSEYTPSGRQILDGSFVLGVSTYRAYRFPWTGQPLTHPSVAATSSSGAVTVYASWNGATQVAHWRVLAGATATTLTPRTTATRTGFETRIGVEGHPGYVSVQARSASGQVLSTSSTVTVPSG